MPSPLTSGTVSAQKVQYHPYPCDTPLSMFFRALFGAGIQEYSLDLNNAMELKNINAVESLFIDALDVNADVDFLINGTTQRIRCPAASQMYVPVLSTNPFGCTISSTGSGTLQFQVMNFPVPLAVWTP